MIIMPDNAQEILASGNAAAILALIIVALVAVVVYQNHRINTLYSQLISLNEKWRESETSRGDRVMQIADTSSAVQAALVDKVKAGRGQL